MSPQTLSAVGATMGDMPPLVADAPFVGRAEPLRRLAGLLDGAAAGRPAAVVVGGDAGVGKTRLVAELDALARARGFVVATGRSVDLGAGGLPYLPFVDAVRSLTRTDGPAADVVRHSTAEWPVLLHLVGRAGDSPRLDDSDRLPLFDAAASLLARLAEEVAPLLLVLEDVHWADPSTRDLLRFLLSRLGSERLLVTLTVRTDDLHRRHPVRPLLAELVRLPGVERVDLQPFDEAELGRLLTSVAGGAVPASLVEDIARRCGGNAFFALELLAAAGAGSAAAPADLPWALSDVLMTRVEGLSAPAVEVVRAASVAGRCVTDRLLRAVVADAAPGTAPEPALREALDWHVLVADGDGTFSFRHALLQEAVYSDLLPGERVRLHAAYARALAADPGDDEEGRWADLAEHALRSHDTAAALTASWQAALDAVARLAPLAAHEHAETALGLWDAVPADRRPDGLDHIALLVFAATVTGQSGDRPRAVALATAARDEALATGDRLRVAHARRHLARQLYGADLIDACIEEASLARAALLDHPPSEDLVWATAVLANAKSNFGDGAVTADLATQGLLWARELGLAAAEADLLVTLSLVRPGPSDGTGADGGGAAADDGTAWLLRARERARAAGEHSIELRALWNLGRARHEVDDLAGAVTIYREVQERAAQTGLGASLYAVEVRLALVEVLFRRGEWDEALRVAAAPGLRLGRRDTASLQVAAQRVVVERTPEAFAAVEQRVRAAGRDETAALNAWADISLHVHGAVASTWCGAPDAAVAHVEAALARLTAEDDELHLVSIRAAAHGLAALAQQGHAADPARADAFLERAERAFAGARPLAARGVGPEAVAWLTRARVDRARVARAGRPDGADVEPWQQVLAVVPGQPYEEALARYRLAEALVAAGDRDGAAAQALPAYTTAVAFGARPLRAALEALGRRARLDLGAGVPSSDGPLTPREAEVLRLVAEGLTNRAIGERLFISEKTASVHVSNLMAKLGASGRAEAVAIAGRRGLLADV
ncbi:LuxR family transcriptional regulator [Kineosporia sp. A_224]|uniref:helix-turn-helix transcriptional regulator n=1 Tax=Kineosporia sp. A_224 TaxID=1962180 RepID=UPI000B4BDCE0|nr:LuxR family transcriptional regulator [Kineosporia sp. A_224]